MCLVSLLLFLLLLLVLLLLFMRVLFTRHQSLADEEAFAALVL